MSDQKTLQRPDLWLNNNVPMYTNNPNYTNNAIAPAYSSYTQCVWNANGELVCQRIPVKFNPNKYQSYVQFKDFSTPNENYKPNAYRENIDWYESNQQGDCGCLLNKK